MDPFKNPLKEPLEEVLKENARPLVASEFLRAPTSSSMSWSLLKVGFRV